MAERLRIVDDGGRPALMVDGVIVSVAVNEDELPPGYWSAMLPRRRPASALILGLGGGTLAQLLSRRYPGITIVGVDADAALVEFARRHFGLSLPELTIVVGDAFSYAASCARRFDYVAVDLFRGYQFQRQTLAKPFLRRLASMAGETGEVVFNLFADRRTERHLRRIGRVLAVQEVITVGKNVIAHSQVER